MLKMVEECSSEALAEMVLHDGIALAQKAQAFSGVKGRMGRITMNEVVEACKVMAIARNTQQIEHVVNQLDDMNAMAYRQERGHT